MAEMASLKTVIVAGEACSPELVQRHYSKLPSVQLYNEYGPTEGTVWSTVHHCQAGEQEIDAVDKDMNQRLELAIGVLVERSIGMQVLAHGWGAFCGHPRFNRLNEASYDIS